MQSIFQSVSSFVSEQFTAAQAAVQGTPNLAASLEFTKADVLQAEEAERERRTKSYEFKECALANAKSTSNLVRAAGFPQPGYLQGAKKRSRIIEELERTRRVQNHEESHARREVSAVVSNMINSLGWPFIRTKPAGFDPSVTRREIDGSLNRLASLVSQQQDLIDVKRLEEEERTRRETDAQGQLKAIQTAAQASLSVEGHMVDAVTREERERERRRDSQTEAVAKSNANQVARLVHNYRQETLAQSSAVQEAVRRAGAKAVSDMILKARHAFELTRATIPSGSEVSLQDSVDHHPATVQALPADSKPVQTAADSVYVVPSTYAVAPHLVAHPNLASVESLLSAPTTGFTSAPPVVNTSMVSTVADSGRVPQVAGTCNQPVFARTYSTAGSLSPTIFPLRRSTPISSSSMRPSEDSAATPNTSLDTDSRPRYSVVIIPDPVAPAGLNRRSFTAAPELSRTSSTNTLVELPQTFVAHPLSRSLSAHELSFLKKEATKHEKMSAKQIKQAEKLMNKSEKLKSKGKLEKAKEKQVKAFELRKEALKHEETANKSKFGNALLTPAPAAM